MQTNRSNTGALVAGTILIVFGLMALAGQFFRVVNWGFLASLAVTGMGALFFIAMFAGGKQAAAFAIPGSIIGGIGLVMLLQFITRQWESLSYFWTLIIMFVGIGIYIMGWYSGDANQRQSGWRVMKVGFILFLIFGILFGLIASHSLTFPILLIILGLYLLLSRSGLLGGRQSEGPSDNSIPPAS
jgi:hypothetical protein